LNKISLKEEINSKNNLIDELEKRIKLLESQLEANKDEVILHLSSIRINMQPKIMSKQRAWSLFFIFYVTQIYMHE
jgi:hypothetical protein